MTQNQYILRSINCWCPCEVNQRRGGVSLIRTAGAKKTGDKNATQVDSLSNDNNLKNHTVPDRQLGMSKRSGHTDRIRSLEPLLTASQNIVRHNPKVTTTAPREQWPVLHGTVLPCRVPTSGRWWVYIACHHLPYHQLKV